jgi:hypothetical protein
VRKRIVIAAAIIAVGVGVAGAIVAFAFADTDKPKTCAEILADPPEGGWTCYGPMPGMGWAGDPEHSVVVHE